MAGFVDALRSAPAAIAVTVGPQHRLAYQNAASVARFGARQAQRPFAELFPEVDASFITQLDLVLRTGGVNTVPRHPVGVLDVDGRPVHMTYALAPLRTPDGGVDGVVITAVDLTSEARAELVSSQSLLLAEVSEQVSRASDPQAALQAFAELLVPRVADLAAVYVTEDRTGDRIGPQRPEAPAEPAASALTPALAALGPPPGSHRSRSAGPWDEALLSGTSLVLPFEGGGPGALTAQEPALAWLRAARTHNLVVVPLAVAGVLTGALVLLSAGSRPPFTELDLPFLTDLTARTGAAVSQLRHVREQLALSKDLQRALLPSAPPRIQDLEVAARYIAGAPEVDVGGDWWDVVRLDERRVGIGVGDVCGRGVSAAVVMGHARAAMRAAALAGLDPGRLLELLDVQLADLIADRESAHDRSPQFATAAYLVLDVLDGRVQIANAGHVPVLVHRPGAATEQIQVPAGPPLGLGLSTGYPVTELQLPRGAELMLYTDGLVESRTQDVDVGVDRLCRLLEEWADRPVQQALDGVLEALGVSGDAHPQSPDDIAAVLIRRS